MAQRNDAKAASLNELALVCENVDGRGELSPRAEARETVGAAKPDGTG